MSLLQTLLNNFQLSKIPKLNSHPHIYKHQKPSLSITKSQSLRHTRKTHIALSFQNNVSDDTQELELLNKPSPASTNNGLISESQNEPEKDVKDKALEPFLKFFKEGDNEEDDENNSEFLEQKGVCEDGNNVRVEYYDAKKGDFVVGVVVSGNENKLDVNVGAEFLGVMLCKEVLPFYGKEIEYLLCDAKSGAEGFMVRGKMGVVRDEDAMGGEGRGSPGRPVVEVGTVLFAEVLGRTLSGRPLLSCRRLFRRVAWHRVRQIKQLNQPIEVNITEWNTGGLLTRIEGLRGFLPKAELLNRVKTFGELKENVGRRMNVLITRIDEDKNDLILSEKQAWELLYLQEGTLLEGSVKKILPYGAQITIAETNRSGLLHISNITRGRVTSISDLLAVDEKVKVLVLKSTFPGKISLSTADLESEPGLFLSNKERVFSEAEEMAKKYRQKLPVVSVTRNLELPRDALPFDNEAKNYANWEWFKFERDCKEDQQ